MHECSSIKSIRGNDTSQPLIVLLGTSVQFSDRMVRVLGLEFDGVRFERFSSLRDLLNLEDRPNVLIMHGTDPNLKDRVAEARENSAGTLIAIACNDTQILQQLNQSDSFPPVSALDMTAQLDVWFSLLRLFLCGYAYVPVETIRDVRSDQGRPADIQLTPREMQTLKLIAEGKQNKVIAAELGLSEHTVKLHTHNIYSKLRVSNRTCAASWYLSQVEGSRNVDTAIHTR